MKRSSWEIILAGLIFVGVGVYVVGNSSSPQKRDKRNISADSVQVDLNGKDIKVIKLEKLADLKNLENLENLKNLKNLGNFLPAEVRADLEKEINEVMKEFEDESLEVKINKEEGTVEIQRALAVDSASGWTSVSPGVFAYVKEFDADALENAAFNIPFGSIEIIGQNSGPGKLTLQASGQISNKDDLLSIISVTEQFGRQKADFQIRSASTSGNTRNINIQATLHLPADIDLNATTAAGHISSQNVDGQQHYRTQGGHISLKELTGKVNAKTSGGHVSLNDSKGTFVLQSSGGHISAMKSEGDISMKTSGGNIQATDILGGVQASTNGGNIELHFLELTGKTFASTDAGTITLLMPTNTNATFELSGNTINIPSAFNFEGQNTSGKATGTIGTGAHTVNAKTSYGNIILKPLE